MKRRHSDTSKGSARPLIRINIVETEEETTKKLNIVEIRQHFTRKLVGQEQTFRKLASILYPFISDGKGVLPLLFNGVSGTGKTKSVKFIRSLFGITREQYVYFDLTRTPLAEDLTLILGAAPGYIGYNSQTRTIPCELLRAIGRPYTETESSSSPTPPPSKPTKPRSTQNSVLPSTIPQPQPPPPPHTILLHFDELDKADSSFLTLLLNFLETGVLTSTASVDFILPSETRLIVVFTANYAKEEIAALDPMTDYRQAQQLTREAMEKLGVHKAVFGRVQHILPFFKLDDDMIAPLIKRKILKSLDKPGPAYTPYFTGFTYEEQVINAIKRILAVSDPTLGMREIKLNLHNFKLDLCAELLTNIIEYKQHLTLPLSGKDLRLAVEHFPLDQHDHLLALMKESPFAFPQTILRSIRENILNANTISLLMLRYHGEPLTSVITTLEHNLLACANCHALQPKESLTYKGLSSVEGQIIFHLSRVCQKCKYST